MTTRERFAGDAVNSVLAAAVFLLTLAVYTTTMYPSVPFWDGGEYIAASYILGVPHAPGTPLYVLLGRIFTLIPAGEIAQRVNWFSALASAVTILFTYLIGVKFAHRVFAPPGDPRGLRARRPAYLAGVVGALLAAFATTFWDNAIEAEVYAAAAALMTFCVWLILRWEERLDEGSEDGLLILIAYIIGLGVGVHLGVAIAASPAVAFVFVCRPRYLRQWNYVGWAIVVLSLGLGINKLTFLWAPGVLAITLILYLFTGRLRRLAFWSAALFMAGLSVHLYLIIRSSLDPAINEAAPKDWHSLWLMLIRDQYKPGSPFDRRADFEFQFGTMYLRYVGWNLSLFAVKGWQFFHLPVVLAVIGAVVHFLRDRKTALVAGLLFVFLGPAMAFYLNFRDPEVRERDYFFAQNCQFLALWVGIGAAWVVEELRRRVSRARVRRATAAGTAAFTVMALVPMGSNWFEHDRSGFYLAEDYAHNMLAPLDPDAVLFTNGDNDTFPLWYLQEVEGFRRDVRVVNVSLLNTDWYMRQLRDLEPKVPLGLTDGQIDTVIDVLEFLYGQYNGNPVTLTPEAQHAWDRPAVEHLMELMQAKVRRDGRGIIVKDVAADAILRANAGRRPVFFAVTIPDQMGLSERLVMEGLVFRMHPEPVEEPIDREATERNLKEVYAYRGLVLPDPHAPEGVIGVHDRTVYKDPNAVKLSQNYGTAFTRLAVSHYEYGDYELALIEMQNADVVVPEFTGVADARGIILESTEDWPRVEAHYREMADRYPGDWLPLSRLGVALYQQERYDESIDAFRRSIDAEPTQFEPYQGLLTVYYNLDRYVDALDVLEGWLAVSPADSSARRLYEDLKESAEGEELAPGGGAPGDSGR